MTPQPELIDEIVSNVLRQLSSGDRHRLTHTSGAAPRSGNPAADSSGPADSQVLVLSTLVVTEAELQDASAGGRTVSIPPGAVITPSGREFMRKYKVTVSEAATSKVAGSGVGVLLHSKAANGTAVIAAASGVGWTIRSLSSDIEVTKVAAERLRETSVVCCCAEASVVACLLNRDPSVRAAVADPATDLATLLTAMNPHVICIGSNGWSVADVRRVLQAVTRHPRISPSGWTELRQGAAV